MTEQKKIDRRVLRTRQSLFTALMALMMEKQYSDITVRDIADEANIGRATFYLHYKDKDDLLASNLEALFVGMAERIRPLLRQAIMSGQPLPSEIVFNEVQQNASLYKMILTGQGGTVVWQRLYQTIINLYTEVIQALIVGGDSPIDVGILGHFVAGSMLSVLKWWLENDMPHSPAYMAASWKKMIQPSMMAVVMLDNDWYAQAEKGKSG